MLQSIRDNAKGWIAYLIVGIIIVPFALFGINQYFEGGGELNAAIVNGEKIPVRDVQNQLRQLQQQFGGQLPEGMEESLKQTALETAINQKLVEQKIREDGYRASNEEVREAIATIPVFQKDGKFDPETYSAFLQMQGQSPAGFELQVRNDLSRQQLQAAVMDTAFIPKAEMETYQALRNQQREVETFTLKTADFSDQVQITDEQIAGYYEQNKAAFMTEERVQLSYVEVKSDALASDVAVDEATLQAWFEENADRYVQPEERIASHILVSVEDPSKDAAAKERIDALYAEIQAGSRTFEEVASTDSDDKLAAEKQGQIGAIFAGDWGPEFERTAFSLPAGEMSEPVKTEAGYEIIRIDEVKPAVQKTFAESRAEVESDYRREQAEEAFLDKAETIGRIAYEQDGDLAPAAEAVGLSVQQTDWMTRLQGAGIATNAAVRDAAFSDDVLNAGKNSELLELGDGHAVVVRIANHEPARQKPLDDVREDIRTILLAQEARTMTAQKGEELLEKLKAGSSWDALNSSGLGDATSVQKPGLVGRHDGKLVPEVAEQAFAMNKPADGQVSWSSVAQANGDYTIIALRSVKAGEATLDEGAKAIYGQSIGSRELNAFLQTLREEADVETFPGNL